MQAKVRVSGAPTIGRNLTKVEKMMRRKMQEALERAGWVFLVESRKRTPVDTGLLRANNDVRAVATPTGGSAYIAYYQDYAPHVHERMELQHKTGEAKFLENALNNTPTRLEAMRVAGAQLDIGKRVT